MNRPIQKGDLVMLVKSCNGKGPYGIPFTVHLVAFRELKRCCLCHGQHDGLFAWSKEPFDVDGDVSCPVDWLIRIDPPAIDESEQTEKELAL